MNNKPSRLSKEQVIWLNCLILALLIAVVAIVVFMAPKSIVRTISLVVTTPIAMLALLGSCAFATNFDEYPPRVELVLKLAM